MRTTSSGNEGGHGTDPHRHRKATRRYLGLGEPCRVPEHLSASIVLVSVEDQTNTLRCFNAAIAAAFAEFPVYSGWCGILVPWAQDTRRALGRCLPAQVAVLASSDSTALVLTQKSIHLSYQLAPNRLAESVSFRRVASVNTFCFVLCLVRTPQLHQDCS